MTEISDVVDLQQQLGPAVDAAVESTIAKALSGLEQNLRATAQTFAAHLGGVLEARDQLTRDEVLNIAAQLLVPRESFLVAYTGAALRQEVTTVLQERALAHIATAALKSVDLTTPVRRR